MPNIGDTVRFLNSVGGGVVTRIQGNVAYVEDADGFEVPMLLKECVVVMPASKQTAAVDGTMAQGSEHSGNASAKASANAARNDAREAYASKAPAVEPRRPSLPLEETDYGDKVTLLLVFEPDNLKALSTSGFRATLVNDSNYYINFVVSSRGSDERLWHFRRADVVEPNIMLDLGHIEVSDINTLENILMQYIPYKVEKDFEEKAPGSVALKIDTTKFCKLHCFRADEYFDTPVLSFPIVENDRPWQPVKISAKEIRDAINEKKRIDRPAARPIKKQAHKKDEPLVVDLHIHELVDTTSGMTPADMLNLQVDEFRRVMDSNLRHHGMKIIFIHGKGEGKLREAIYKELNYRYKGHDYCDASFREYGFGATQVTIH